MGLSGAIGVRFDVAGTRVWTFRVVTERESAAALESDLITRTKRGDDAAYAGLLRLHEQVSFRLAYQVTGDRDEAVDAVQEAYIRAFRAIDRFRDGAPFRPWLLKIVLNESRWRRRSRG